LERKKMAEAMTSSDTTLTYVSLYPKVGGARITSYVVGIHGDSVDALKEKAAAEYPEAVCIEQDAAAWSAAVDGNLYYDAETGVLTDPLEPTEEERRESALAALDAEYEQKISDIETEMAKAAAIGDDDLKAELAEERAALVSEYEEKREEI